MTQKSVDARWDALHRRIVREIEMQGMAFEIHGMSEHAEVCRRNARKMRDRWGIGGHVSPPTISFSGDAAP